MNLGPRSSWLDEIRLLLRCLFWLVGVAVLVVLALFLAMGFGDVCYHCSSD